MDQLLMPLVMSMTAQHASNSSMATISFLILLVFNVFTLGGLDVVEKVLSFFSRDTHLSLTARISSRNNSLWSTNYPKNFLAVNRKIQQHLMNDMAQNRMRTGSPVLQVHYQVHEFHHHSFGDKDKDPITFFELSGLCGKRGLDLVAGSGIRVTTSLAKERGEKDFNYTNLHVKIHSKRGYRAIKEFVDLCTREHEEALLSSVKAQHVFVFDKCCSETDRIKYSEIAFDTTKNFGNMFFDAKDTVVRALDNFAGDVKEYGRLGIPHTIGFLFHGIQGSGKTSCIKCIARHTRRHLVVVSMKRIRDIDTLKRVFLDDQINGVSIPNSHRLYVFEEVDCGPWSDVMTSRSLSDQERDRDTKMKEERDQRTALGLLDLIERVQSQKDADSNGDRGRDSSAIGKESRDLGVNLGEFLELLDGIIEVPGRMIIMTSNRPEVLDKALIRPGRIDHVVEFGFLSLVSIVELYSLWFGVCPPDHVSTVLRQHFENGTGEGWTQAQLGNLFATRDMAGIHTSLTLPSH
jgi:hypothetical protein